ncbi:MAG: aspartate-alanine antiporter [Thermodesulfobacteriota bacterium]|nr:aspartate-alanine antiporter [Thermodesulfobacteriota bacterium]
MEFLQSLFSESAILPVFLAVALGYAVGKIRIGQFQLGGLAGTLIAAIFIGLYGVQTDETVKSIAFALFIYSLGFVSGPQFFGSLGRDTLGQVHLAVFSSLVIFGTIWIMAQVFGLDKGTAAGLLAGATTESASIGTAGDALKNLDLDADTIKKLQANITVTYAVTYLFGMTLVVFFTSKIAPRLLKVKDFKVAARALEEELGADSGLAPGQFEFIRKIIARVYRVESDGAEGLPIKEFKKRYSFTVTFQHIYRNGESCDITPDLVLKEDDLVTLVGLPESVLEAGRILGVEVSHAQVEEDLVGEIRDVVVTRKDRINKTVLDLRHEIAPEKRRGAYAVRLTRMERDIPLLPKTEAHLGDVVRLVGIPEGVKQLADELGHTINPNEGVDYIYLALGITAGIILGSIPVSIAGTTIEMGLGGGCLISGLIFGWIRAKHPTFGNLPSQTAVHLRDFGLTVFIACIGLAAGPQAFAVIQDKGVMLPLLAISIVLISLLSSMLYARYVIKMNPVLITGALAGLLTCTPALNAAVTEADSEMPVLGYTVPYAIANVLLTLLGPVIVLCV